MPYYMCEVIGSGTEDDPRRPVVANYPGLAWITIYDNNPLNTKGCLVYCPNPTPEMEADPKVRKISKASLDDSYTGAEFDLLKQILADNGIMDTAEINNTHFNCMRLINWIGRKLTGFHGFDLKNYSVDYPGDRP